MKENGNIRSIHPGGLGLENRLGNVPLAFLPPNLILILRFHPHLHTTVDLQATLPLSRNETRRCHIRPEFTKSRQDRFKRL